MTRRYYSWLSWKQWDFDGMDTFSRACVGLTRESVWGRSGLHLRPGGERSAGLGSVIRCNSLADSRTLVRTLSPAVMISMGVQMLHLTH